MAPGTVLRTVVTTSTVPVFPSSWTDNLPLTSVFPSFFFSVSKGSGIVEEGKSNDIFDSWRKVEVGQRFEVRGRQEELELIPGGDSIK